jgi:hypothetical protein
MCCLRKHVSNIMYIFRFCVTMELPCEICTAKMLPKGELVEIDGRWGAHPSCLILAV